LPNNSSDISRSQMEQTVTIVRSQLSEGLMAASDKTQEATNGRRVLVVEDDPASRRALVSLLRLNGYEALFAANLAEAIALLDARPECVLLDLMLPDGTGTTILHHVRSLSLPIKVAITTGAADWRKFMIGTDHRPDAIFIKPLDFESITKWLSVDE
jgi:two-component system, OmpR family, KDP operon response regulator KdpE